MKPEDFFGTQLDQQEEQLTSLVYWYPLLVQIGMRVPETYIIHRGPIDLWVMLDGETPDGWGYFKTALLNAMNRVGFPCFLRTGQTSHKHAWKDTCFIGSPDDIENHVYALLEASVMANIAGPPFSCDFWIVRKMIETKPVLRYFNDMPIAPELRFFIRDRRVQCVHPYWPSEAFEDEDAQEKANPLLITAAPEDEVYEMAEYVAKRFSGYWSIDFLQDATGQWWCIDMATGERSWHMPGCNRNHRADEECE